MCQDHWVVSNAGQKLKNEVGICQRLTPPAPWLPLGASLGPLGDSHPFKHADADVGNASGVPMQQLHINEGRYLQSFLSGDVIFELTQDLKP